MGELPAPYLATQGVISPPPHGENSVYAPEQKDQDGQMNHKWVMKKS